MKIGCVLLASGLSKRFGRNKLVEEFKGKALIERTFDALPVELFSDVVVATAYDEIEEMAYARGFRVVRNPHPETGIGGTVKLGVASMAGTDACMICVCDQPCISKETLQGMIEAYRGGIMAASFDGHRGNPVIFHHSLYAELLAIADSRSGKHVMEKHLDMLALFPVPDKRELKDIDYLHDIETF
ncbi:nucleotidyltransferase family protein [Christensenellaceae bacterium OttesenSCG-928-K19]|nr:nucleotidyltransferase family protein [Christensenellaceae bacterium OttesenSCG-928-K19]